MDKLTNTFKAMKGKIIIYLVLLSCVISFKMESFNLVSDKNSYTNPVQGQRDSPDPGVMKFEDKYYAVTTMGWDNNFFPIWESQDLTTWKHVGWGINQKEIPGWTQCCTFWAPQLHIVNKQFMIYYTARTKTGKLSIGIRHSNKILGPYEDRGSPIVQNQLQGTIDATIATQEESPNKQKYLIYKIDGNSHGAPTPIYAVKLSQDGLSVFGNHTLLIKNDQPWEKGIVQAPWVIKRANFYYLFYSGQGYASKGYGVGVARSQKLLGPYVKFPQPILHTRIAETNNSWEGPGHCSVVKGVNGNDAIIYHAWPHGKILTKRVMLLDEILYQNGWPLVNKDGSPSQGNTRTP